MLLCRQTLMVFLPVLKPRDTNTQQAQMSFTHMKHSRSQTFSPSAEPDGDRQQTERPSAQLRKMGTEELSTSFSTAGVTEETQILTQR